MTRTHFHKPSLALDYHENSKHLNTIQAFDTNTPYKVYPSAKAIPLEKNDINVQHQEEDTFLQALLSRKSTRSFSIENFGLKELSRLLTLGCGLRNDSDNLKSRTYASAGARFPVEVYAAMLQPSDIEQGVYHYNVKDNALELIKTGDCLKEIQNFYRNQSTAILTEYPCLILFSVILERSMQKYGERGYRFAFLDAGHMGQNLYLVAEYLQLGIVALGAGADSDNKMDDILGLTPGVENSFYGFAVGYPQITKVSST